MCAGCESHSLPGLSRVLRAWKATHRALMRRPALNADFKGRIAPVEMHGAKLPGLMFSQQRTEKVIKKIVLRLHYHHTGKRFPTNVEAKVFYQPDKLLEDSLKSAQHKGYFGDSFSYAGAVSAEGDAVWWLSFYASVLFIVVLLPSGLEEPKVPPASKQSETEPNENAD